MTHQVVWGWPVLAEEVLFGIGAGAFIVAALLHLRRQQDEDRPVLRASFVTAGIAAILGNAVLLLELGQPTRAAPGLYPTNPFGVLANAAILNTSILSKTALLLIIFLGLSIIVGVGWLFTPRSMNSIGGRVFEGLGLIFAILTGLQGGLLLAAQTQRTFWGTPVFPYLYLITAVTTGIGIVGILAARRTPDTFPTRGFSLVTWALLLVLVQAAALVTHLAVVDAPREVLALLSNPAPLYAPTFYIGVVVLGLLVPGAYGARLLQTGRLPTAGSASLVFVALILGALALRIAFLFVGQLV